MTAVTEPRHLRILTPEGRQEGLRAAAKARAERAELLNAVRAGTLTVAQVLAQADHPVAGKTRLRALIAATPGWGETRTRQLLDRLAIGADRAIRGLGPHQQARLLALLAEGPTGKARPATEPNPDTVAKTRARGSMAMRLAHLFDTVLDPDTGKPFTQTYVSQCINAEAGTGLVSPPLLSQLCSGQRQDPSYRRVQAIADFFGVSASYFSPSPHASAHTAETEMKILAASHNPLMRQIVLAADGLGSDLLRATLVNLVHARSEAGLAPAPSS